MFKKIAPILLIAAMLLGFSMGAFAATSDPNMTNYLTPWTQVYGTNQLQATGGSTTNLQAGPASSGWAFTGYDSAADAFADASWIIEPGSTAAVSIVSTGAVAASGGKYAARAVVKIAANSPSGFASVKAIRNNGAYMSFSIVVNQTNFLNIIVPDGGITVGSRFYGGSGESLASVSNLSVLPGSYGDDRSFNTVLDALAAGTPSVVASFTAAGGYVSGITIGSTYYGENLATGEGWNYRVYRNQDADPALEIVPVSEFVGVSDFALQNRDVIVWRYGTYGTYFPDTIV